MQNEVTNFGNNVRSKDISTVYYLLIFLSDFATNLMSATYVLFLLSKNLDLFQVMLVNLAFMVGNFIFEIPTGAYADYFGRKKSVILSSIFIMITLLIYFESSTLVWFIIAEVIGALSFTFASGALDAWMVDEMDRKGNVGRVDYVFSHASLIGTSAALLGGLVGGYIGSVSLALPFGAGAVVAFVSLLVAIFFMHENFAKKNNLNIGNSIGQITQIAKDSINYGLRHKVVFWLVLSSLVAMFAFMPLNMYWSPRMNELAGNQVWLMGWIWAGISLFIMLGSFLAKKLLQRKKSFTWVLVATSLFLAIPIILASVSNIFAIALTGFLMYEIGRGMLKPTHKAYLNKYIPSKQRATVLSFDSMVGKLGAAFGLVVLGWIAKNSSIQVAWMISGVSLLLLIPLYLKAKRRENI